MISLHTKLRAPRTVTYADYLNLPVMLLLSCLDKLQYSDGQRRFAQKGSRTDTTAIKALCLL